MSPVLVLVVPACMLLERGEHKVPGVFVVQVAAVPVDLVLVLLFYQGSR